MAIEDLKIPPDRVDTIADFDARGESEVPIAGVFALDDVQDAFRHLEVRHTRGKLVLRPIVNE